MKRIFTVLAALFLISCEKENENFPIPYPSTYTSLALENSSKVKIFTKQGEVTNPQAINSFVQRYGDGFLYMNGFRLQTSGNSISDSLKILSASNAQLKHSYQTKWKDYTLRPIGQELDFIAQDTVLGIGDSQYETRDRYLYVLAKAFHKNWYEYFETPKLPFPGYAVKFVEKIVVQITPTQLVFPRMNYVLRQHREFVGLPDFYSNPQAPYNLYKVSGINNSIKGNPDYAQLATGDTLALQDFKFIWERK